MKKIILAISLMLLSVTANIAYAGQHSYYVETNEYNNSISISYDTHEITLNFFGFENKTFKFNDFRTSISDGYVVNTTTAICDDTEYDVRMVYSIPTKQTFYVFTDKKNGSTLEYRFG